MFRGIEYGNRLIDEEIIMKERSLKEKIKENESAVIMARKVLVDDLDFSKRFKWTKGVLKSFVDDPIGDYFKVKEFWYDEETKMYSLGIWCDKHCTKRKCVMCIEDKLIEVKEDALEYYEIDEEAQSEKLLNDIVEGRKFKWTLDILSRHFSTGQKPTSDYFYICSFYGYQGKLVLKIIYDVLDRKQKNKIILSPEEVDALEYYEEEDIRRFSKREILVQVGFMRNI